MPIRRHPHRFCRSQLFEIARVDIWHSICFVPFRFGERSHLVGAHDSGYKQLFSFPAMVEDLLRGFVRERWVDDLDFGTL